MAGCDCGPHLALLLLAARVLGVGVDGDWVLNRPSGRPGPKGSSFPAPDTPNPFAGQAHLCVSSQGTGCQVVAGLREERQWWCPRSGRCGEAPKGWVR